MRLAPSKIREFGAAADPPRAQCQRRAPLSLRSGSGGFEKLPVHLDIALIPGALPSGSTIASRLMIQPSHSGPNTRRSLCSLNSFTADFPGFRRPDFVSVCGRQCDVAPGRNELGGVTVEQRRSYVLARPPNRPTWRIRFWEIPPGGWVFSGQSHTGLSVADLCNLQTLQGCPDLGACARCVAYAMRLFAACTARQTS